MIGAFSKRNKTQKILYEVIFCMTQKSMQKLLHCTVFNKPYLGIYLHVDFTSDNRDQVISVTLEWCKHVCKLPDCQFEVNKVSFNTTAQHEELEVAQCVNILLLLT